MEGGEGKGKGGRKEVWGDSTDLVIARRREVVDSELSNLIISFRFILCR